MNKIQCMVVAIAAIGGMIAGITLVPTDAAAGPAAHKACIDNAYSAYKTEMKNITDTITIHPFHDTAIPRSAEHIMISNADAKFQYDLSLCHAWFNGF